MLLQKLNKQLKKLLAPTGQSVLTNTMQTLPGDRIKLSDNSLHQQAIFKKIIANNNFPSFRKYNLTISHTHKFIWFRVAKAGTRTIYSHFKGYDIPLEVEHAHKIRYPLKKYQDYFKFAFVRNPWDRLVSCWKSKVVHMNYFKFSEQELEKMKVFSNFLDFVEKQELVNGDNHLGLQHSLIDLNNIDYLGRMENFDADFKKIQALIKLPSAQAAILPRNVSALKTPYQAYYTPKLIDRVGRLYQKDIQIFGYQFE